jgi:CheY-like chemotaxis protein
MMTIYLAEDDLDDQELLAEAFSEIDPSIRLYSFSSGKQILEELSALHGRQFPDLIILDYNIPEINGAEILSLLARDEKFDKVVKLVWSTSDNEYYESACMALGAKAYLVKPSNISALVETARKMLTYIN